MNEDKTMLLQESLDKISKKVNLRGKKMVVTMPASKFYVKTLEYSNSADENLDTRIDEDLEDIISGYTKEEFITQKEIVYENTLIKKIFIVTIQVEKIEKIIEILSNFKIKVLKIIPDFIALNNLVDLLDQKSTEENNENIMVVDIGGETSKIFISRLGMLNMLRIVGIGGNDFTEIIKDHEMLDYEAAELEKRRLELGDEENKEYKTQGEVTMFKELTSLVNELTIQIENSVEYFNTNLIDGKISKILLTGGGSLIKGFKKYFDESFDMLCDVIDLEPLNLVYKKEEDKELLSTFEIGTLLGALINEVR
jgi:type IV pilus assembly protein PilM